MDRGGGHAISDAIAVMEAAAVSVADSPAWSIPGSVIAEDLARLHRLAARVAELELRLVAQADASGIAGDHGAATTYALWSLVTRQTRAVTKKRQQLAAALDGGRAVTREAMTRGEVSEAHAQVIVEAVEALADLPPEIADQVDPSVVERAEKDLVRLAADHDPVELRRLGKHILDVVAPEVGEAAEAAALAREEEQAAAKARFTLSEDGHGQVHGRFSIPALHGSMLRTMIQALWQPSMGDGPRGHGQAFMELIERYPTDHLPTHGGVAATVTVTMTTDQLDEDLAEAGLTPDGAGPDPSGDVADQPHRPRRTGRPGSGVCPTGTGVRITAGLARRLACEAELIPVVLGGRSAVLDVGRAARFHTKPQRVAIALRDQTCTAQGCDYPPGLCHVHHDHPWSTGGGTSVATGRLLCPRHHRMIHSSNFQISISKHGRVIFRRT